MQAKTKSRIGELQMIISKMPIQLICSAVLPEFGLHWRDVFRSIRNARLPMTPTSVARLLCRQVNKSWTQEEIADIVAKLRLKMAATQRRTWHVIKLVDQISNEAVNVMSSMLPLRVRQALTMSKSSQNMRPEVQTVKLGDFIYISVQMLSAVREGGVLYVATPPGEPVALVSSVHSSLLKACVQGLGYKTYEDACLHGQDVSSLLQIYNSNYTEHVYRLAGLPEYTVAPCLARGGIDYTGRMFDEKYAQQALGPNPPNLSTLDITAYKEFCNPQILNKKIKVQIKLHSENVAKSLQAWAAKGAILPTSELFTTFHTIKSNKIYISSDQE